MDKESSSMYKFQPVCHPGRGSYSGDHDFHHHPFDGPTGPTGASPDWLGRDRRLLHLHHSGAYPPGQWQGQSELGGIPHCCHPHIRGIFCLRTGINTMDGCRYIHITQLQMHKGYLFCLSQLNSLDYGHLLVRASTLAVYGFHPDSWGYIRKVLNAYRPGGVSHSFYIFFHTPPPAASSYLCYDAAPFTSPPSPGTVNLPRIISIFCRWNVHTGRPWPSYKSLCVRQLAGQLDSRTGVSAASGSSRELLIHSFPGHHNNTFCPSISLFPRDKRT